jgi:hypothetical protein
MAIDIQIRTRSAEGKTQRVMGKFVFSGNYPTGGEDVPISKLAVGTQKRPIGQAVIGASQNNKYLYDDVNQKVVVRTGAAPPVEIAAGPYPASVTTDNVEFNITFHKF